MSVSTENLYVVTAADRPELPEIFWPQKRRIWPPFMQEDIYAGQLWHHVTTTYADHQLYLVNGAGTPMAVVQSIPLVWDGTRDDLPIGWQDGFIRAAHDVDLHREPNTLMALEASILPELRGQRLSYRLLEEIRDLAQGRGYQALIAAVRPSHKARYPLTPMARYARWTNDDGAPFDPWLRVHWRVGAEILHVAYPSMVCHGTLAQWESWTGLVFPESGDYVVPDALVPIQIDHAMQIGRYVEPNVWVHHPFTTDRLADR